MNGTHLSPFRSRLQSPCLLLLLLPVGCGNESEPGVASLARDGEFARLDSPDRDTTFRSLRGRAFRLISRAGEDWLETRLSARDWNPVDKEDGALWFAAVPIRGGGQPKGGGPGQRLLAKDRLFNHEKGLLGGSPGPFASGSFLVTWKGVRLKLARGEQPPAEARLQVFCGRRLSDSHGWRVGGRHFSGDGFSLWPGESMVKTQHVSPGSALRFVTCSEPLLAGASAQDQPIRYSIHANGRPLFAYEQSGPGAVHSHRHTVALPVSGQVELRFEVQGALAYSSFLAPTIGEAQLQGYGARPAEDPRRDIIVFLADTFRADNMAAYGGRLELTPNLDRLAAGSLLFRRSWSVSTHTLPAHASLFTGLYPHQTAVHGEGFSLSGELQTIAEHLSRAGYRTGAVTDSVMVSHRFGMDQGFEWFDERERDFQDPTLRTTLARTRDFLDADDGRPIFLFVQTYRVHIPYLVSPETIREFREFRERQADLEITGDFSELDSTIVSLLETPEAERDWPRLRSAANRLRNHYLGGVVDLDRAFDDFHQELVARGLLEKGVLIFTSDHGEAFLEHEVILHTGTVWEELARIPLFILGAGIEPGVVQYSAGLVDLAPTGLELAGRPPHDGWPGRSLLSLRHDRPAYVFQCVPEGQPTLAMIRGSHKVIGYDRLEAVRDREIFGAFDLDNDPLELRNLAGSDLTWPIDMYRRLGPTVETLMQPLVGVERAALDAEKLQQLREMGYLGDE